MSLIAYDLSFLALFTIFVIIFLYKNRKKITREGPMYLYKTQLGVKLIHYIGGRHGKLIRKLHYTVITISYLLFASILFVIGQTIYIYLKMPEITTVVKTPPLLPLIPYFPQLFGAESLFPPFYFIHFILALIVVAFSHEFSHGIFASANKVRIKSTGVAFLGPILGAFVEQDDEQMKTKGRIPQMAILGAGVFANIIMAALFFLLLLLTFKLLYVPSGAVFGSYSYALVNESAVNNITNLSDNLLLLHTDERNFIISAENLQIQRESGQGFFVAYFDAPAIRNNLSGPITAVNGEAVRGMQDFIVLMEKYKPGDEVLISTPQGDYEITLDEHPTDPTKPFLGIGFRGDERRFITKIFFFKDQNTYYDPLGEFSVFLYELFWWIAMINLMVGMFNMLPFAFLDGGRFFYLTILGLTNSEKHAARAYKIATRVVFSMFILVMLAWLISFRLR